MFSGLSRHRSNPFALIFGMRGLRETHVTMASMPVWGNQNRDRFADRFFVTHEPVEHFRCAGGGAGVSSLLSFPFSPQAPTPSAYCFISGSRVRVVVVCARANLRRL